MDTASPAGARPHRLGGAVALAVLVGTLAVEWSRVGLERELGLGGAAAGALLTAVAAFAACRALRLSPGDLGLGRRGMAGRVLGGLALTVVLLLPAAVRWTGAAPPGGAFTATIALVAAAEEVVFRGVAQAVVTRWAGPAAGVLLTTVAWTAAHALTHPPAFLFAVTGAGLVLSLWRHFTGDLVGPVIGHVLADVLQ